MESVILLIDGLIPRFAHDKKSENNELLLTRISHEVAMLAGQKDKQEIFWLRVQKVTRI